MALDLTYDPNWKPAASGGDLDLTYNPDWKPKSKTEQFVDDAKQVGADLLGKLNIGTTVDIPEQAVGTNELARAVNPMSRIAELVLPDSIKNLRGGVEDKARSAIDARRKDLTAEFSPEQTASDKKQYLTDETSWKNLTSEGIMSAPGKALDLVAEGKFFDEGMSDPRKMVGSAVQSLPSTLLRRPQWRRKPPLCVPARRR